MTAAYILREFCGWWREKIAEKVKLKAPSMGAENKDYSYSLVSPKVIEQDYERSGDVFENVPGFLISISGIENSLPENLKKYEVEVVAVVWSSGMHNKDKFLPTKTPLTYIQDPVKGYTPDNKTGNDLLNLLDFCDNALLSLSETFTTETKGWAWSIEDDPEIRTSDYRVASVKFVLTEPISRAVSGDSDSKEIAAQKAENKNELDSLL